MSRKEGGLGGAARVSHSPLPSSGFFFFFLRPKKKGASGRNPKSFLVQSLCETASGDFEAKHDTGRKEPLGFAQHGSGALESSRAAPGWAASGTFQGSSHGRKLAPHADSQVVRRSVLSSFMSNGYDEGQEWRGRDCWMPVRSLWHYF